MKESRLYLNFFKHNWWIILTPFLICLVASVIYAFTRPNCFSLSQIFQQQYDLTNVSEKVVLVDQAVSMSRSKQVLSSLNVPDNVEVNIFKPSPLSIQVGVSSCNQDLNQQTLTKVANFLIQKYQLDPLGQIVEYKSSSINVLISITLCSLAGLLIGLIVSLIRTYYRNY